MSTKAEVLRDAQSCLNKASAFEPIFVLRANDPIAAQVIRLWAEAARGVHEHEKCDHAMLEAELFDKWRDGNVPTTAVAVPVPACAAFKRY